MAKKKRKTITVEKAPGKYRVRFYEDGTLVKTEWAHDSFSHRGVVRGMGAVDEVVTLDFDAEYPESEEPNEN